MVSSVRNVSCASGPVPWLTTTFPPAADRVVFVTGGAGSICSIQTMAMVYLGANACIIGRNVEKTESKAKEIAAVRKGAKVIGIGAVDVRSVSGPVHVLYWSFPC
jgi:NAD(P)-dependent dehydrogenase (short-subunit alcohol dehydrogenase family)